MKPQWSYTSQDDQNKLDDIAFAKVAFSEQALAIMSKHLPGESDGPDPARGRGSGVPSGGGGGGGGAGGGGERDWDRRLARPQNFVQLCQDDTCGKMRTLKVSWSFLERWGAGVAGVGARPGGVGGGRRWPEG